jgi:hypothetical protein
MSINNECRLTDPNALERSNPANKMADLKASSYVIYWKGSCITEYEHCEESNYLFRIPSGKQKDCSGIESRFRQTDENTASEYTCVVLSYLKNGMMRRVEWWVFGNLDSLTPVKALVIPHSTVQIPMYKEGLVSQDSVSVSSTVVRTWSTWIPCSRSR